jgi:hypothetical protein
MATGWDHCINITSYVHHARTLQPRVIVAGDDPVNESDPMGLSTKGYCLGGAAAFGFHVFGQVCIVTSSSGQIGITATSGGGGGSPNVSASGYEQYSNATNLNQLRGLFAYAGVSGGELISIGANGFIGNDSCGQAIYGTEVGGGVGARLPVPFGIHGGLSDTGVHVFGGAPATALKVGFVGGQVVVQALTDPEALPKEAYDLLSSWL